VQAKANLGSDVRQVLTWSKPAMWTAALSIPPTRRVAENQGRLRGPEGSINKIIYPVSVLKSSPNTDAAKAFITYLQTGGAAAIFEKFGFSMA
jgi:molybdate transport system substrate-binding protein